MAQIETAPHYLRFARALALVSGIAAPMAGCAMQHGSDGDAGPVRSDAPAADTALADAPVDVCSVCLCVFGGDLPAPPESCEAMGHTECCVTVGPLAPPDLPA